MSSEADICIIGRTDFTVGMGQTALCFAELLSQAYDVCFLPTNPTEGEKLNLPSGRALRLVKAADGCRVTIFTDVLWNGVKDSNYRLVPQSGLRIAYFVFDSDAIPGRWVEILNGIFDIGLVPSPHLIQASKDSGVEIPIEYLPIALDLEDLLVEPVVPAKKNKTVFGSLAAFHPRKAHDVVIRSFFSAFGNSPSVQLRLRSNINFEGTKERLQNLVEALGANNISIEQKSTNAFEKNEFLRALDVYVSGSRGEGYSIGPREALALGKLVVLSEVGGHRVLRSSEGIFLVPAPIKLPAIYPEIDGMLVGNQFGVEESAFSDALKSAQVMSLQKSTSNSASERRRLASEFSYSSQLPNYLSAINSRDSLFRKSTPSTVGMDSAYCSVAERKIGPYLSKFHKKHRRIVVAHDGGFYSVFNVFMSHLVWDTYEPSISMVLPDWDVSRIMNYRSLNKFTSFCYGKPEDGNIWLKLFRAPYGLSEESLNDPQFLYSQSLPVSATYNEDREPLLTYKHAYKLYRTADFQRWRLLYNRIYSEQIQLQDHLQSEIDAAHKNWFDGRLMIGVHIRHPSHSIEQPNAQIATVGRYVQTIRDLLVTRGMSDQDAQWGLFLATDQDSVVQQMRDLWGDRVHYFNDVKRTSETQDLLHGKLDPKEKMMEGFQVQHLTAQDPTQWNWRMAWEVIRDTMCLAKCSHLLHVTSNVSTAVSYMNPRIELVYVQ